MTLSVITSDLKPFLKKSSRFSNQINKKQLSKIDEMTKIINNCNCDSIKITYIRNNELKNTNFQDIKVDDFTVQELSEIRLSDLYSFINYMNNNRKDKAPTRARKVACLRSFFKYAWNKI